MEVRKIAENKIGAVFSLKDEFSGKIDGIANKTEGIKGKLGGIGGVAKKGFKIAAGAAAGFASAGTAAFAATNKMVGGFDNIAKTAPKLGITTDAYQEMDYWAGQNGLSTGNMEKAVGRLNQRIGEAKAGNEKYSNALKDTGVNMDAVLDGTLSTEDAMAQSIQGLSQMTNEQDKAALASELFGKKLGRELMPALQDGSLSLEDAKKKAEELGIVIDGKTLESAEVFADTWDDLSRTMGVFGQKILSDLMPIFQTMMEWVIDKMPAIKEVISNAVTGTWNVIKSVYEKIKPVLMWINDVGMPAVGQAFEFVSDKISELFGFVGQAGDKFPELQEKVSHVMENLKNIFSGAVEIITEVWGRLEPVISATWEIIKGLFQTGAVFIGEMITNITDTLSGIIDFIAGVFTGDWERAWTGVVGIFEGIFSTIESIGKGVMNGVISVINGALGGLNKIRLPDWLPGVGGKGINIPLIPRLAKGTMNWGGGIAQVHERGGEIIDLPGGSRVYPHDKTVSMAREQGRKESGNITIAKLADQIIIREEADIDKLAKALVRNIKRTQLNMA